MYRPISVERYSAEVEDGGGTRQNVGGQPDVADNDTERPTAAKNEVSDVEWHNKHGDGEICECQRYDVEVLNGTQRPVREHRNSSGFVRNKDNRLKYQVCHGNTAPVQPWMNESPI